MSPHYLVKCIPVADMTIRIGYLATDLATGGAMTLAIEKAQKEGLLRDYEFR